eukprot:TRINITY_DN5810_c0_g1_i1.p1 TRINITY_DN5810_c0_g1~~TRINITY_DN5810_c0_g1_i1.p1  ORF type:complete len:276 (+),score=114.32 TRINITY_DN5810_c0_g1_i1:96-923(+)
MGACESKPVASAEEVKPEAPVIQMLTSEDVPLWKQVSETVIKEAQASAEDSAKWEAEAAAKKEKEMAEAAAKKEASEKAEAKEDKKAKESKAKKKASAPKKKEEKPAEAVAPAAEAPAPAPAAASGAMDKAACKDRDQAFAKRPKKEQEDLGKQMRVAAKEGNLIEVKSLLDKGVSPNVPDKDGWIAIMEASQAGHAECVQMLLNFGGDAKATLKLGEWGMTALHFAARNGHLECAKILAPASKLEEKNFQSKTAAEVAKANGNKEIAKICKVKS